LIRSNGQLRNNFNKYINLPSKTTSRNLSPLNTLKNSTNVTILDEENNINSRNSYRAVTNSLNKKQTATLTLKPSQKKVNIKKDTWKDKSNKLKKQVYRSM
jgi:hypothetical protein